MKISGGFRWLYAAYMTIAAIGHYAGRADAEVVPPGARLLNQTFAVRQGPRQLSTHSSQTACQAEAERLTPNARPAAHGYQVKTGMGALISTQTDLAMCHSVPKDRLNSDVTKTSGSNINSCVVVTRYSEAFQPPTCVATFNYTARYQPGTTPPPTCPTPPPDQTRPGACPAGTASSWTQTGRTTYGPAPTCAATMTWSPSAPPVNACLTPTGCVGRTCTFGWSYSHIGAEGFRLHYGRTRATLPQTVQVVPGEGRRGQIVFPDSGTWYVGVVAFGGGNTSGLSNIEPVTVP